MSSRKKPPLPLLETFQAVLPKDRRAQKRKLFGNPCCFVNGTMFTGVHEDQLIVRLPDRQRARLLSIEGAQIFEPMKGRPMPEYVRVPPAMLENRRQLRGWVKRAFEYCSSLPKSSATRTGR
jgi:TfoX/Sxy family transcriptional regulator of competence genes